MVLVGTAISSDYRGNVTEREVTVGECDCISLWDIKLERTDCIMLLKWILEHLTNIFYIKLLIDVN